MLLLYYKECDIIFLMSKIKKFAIISSLSGVGLLSPVLSTGCSNNDTTLVVCFSCTGHTIDVANKIVNDLDCSLFQIEPTVAYNPETDFGPDGRANKEQSGELPAPEIKNSIKDFKSYSTFFFGYPI